MHKGDVIPHIFYFTFMLIRFFNEGREDSPVMAAIRATYEAGAVTSGDSAGAACMGKPPMITGRNNK